MIRRAMVVGLAAVLMACGGGGDDAGDGGNGGDGSTGSRVHRYLDQAIPATAAQLNVQGGAGYRYIGLRGYTGATRTLLLNDAAVAYTYEVLATPASLAAFVNQINNEGARGYRLVSYNALESTYIHVTNSTETFTYAAVERAVGGLPADTFVDDANRRGEAGYRHHFTLISGGSHVDLWEKSSVSATYSVRVEEPAANEAAQLARFDTNGQAGYRLHSMQQFVDGDVWMFERDTTAGSDNATFRYFTDTNANNNLTDFLAQANRQGALGRGYDGTLTRFGATRHLYVLAANCRGLLCNVRGQSY